MLLFSGRRAQVRGRYSHVQSSRVPRRDRFNRADCVAFDRWRARWIPARNRRTRPKGWTRPLASSLPGSPSASPGSAPRLPSRSRPRRPLLAAEGHTIYPFHLGDLNIPTPSQLVEASFRLFATARPATARTPASPSFVSRLGGGHQRLARGAATRRERGRPAGRKARHRQVHARSDESGRRGALPEPGLSNLRAPRSNSTGASRFPTATSRAEHGFVIDLDSLEAASRPGRACSS